MRSLLADKFEEQEAQRFRNLQDDLCNAVWKLKTVLNECDSTLKSIRSATGEESERVSTLQEKIRAFEEEACNPLIQILMTRQSLPDQISDTLYRRAELKNLIDRRVQVYQAGRLWDAGGMHHDPDLNFWPERLVWEKEREKDLQAAAILFEGEDGIQRLVSRIERVEDTMAQVKDLREDLDYRLARLREEPIDELEELDALGERMNQLAKWL